MSGSKAVLRAINDAIKQQKYDDVIGQAREFLSKEPDNYQGSVGPHQLLHMGLTTAQAYFLGLCVGQEGSA